MSEAKELLNLTTMQHFSHDHRLDFIERQKNGGEEVYCSACADPIEDCSYCCIDCKFYLHKTCTDLPLNINHPLHQEHSLNLQVKSPYPSGRTTFCDLCFDTEGFFYHCSSCEFHLDVKCALTGEFSKLQHFSHNHPLILVQKQNNRLKLLSCAACDEPTSGPLFRCMYCDYNLHKRCAELPPEITHPSHRRHPLFLLANPPLHQEGCSCHLCKHPGKGFVYHCSVCKFGIRVKHTLASRPENVTHHKHSFILVSRVMQFVCDACGTDGDCFPNICTICNLVVHQKCMSLSHTIKLPLHIHPLSHIYFLLEKEYKQRDCKICYDEVKTERGSYYCSDCDYILHVNCVRESDWLRVEANDFSSRVTMGLVPNPDDTMNSSQDVSATEIKHFSHNHNLMLGEEMIDDTYCDGCMVTISGPFYMCKQCPFFLHKSCAKLPMKTYFWFSWSEYLHQKYRVFRCDTCKFWSSGFSYISVWNKTVRCLRCCAVPYFFDHGRQHKLFYDEKYRGNCSACGDELINYAFRCKKGDFALDDKCISLPQTTRHKNDGHPLKLTYRHDDDDGDPNQHYCDICEDERDPAYWFYSCADCDFTAHPECARGKHPFVNEGVKTTFKCHPHDLVTVRKVYLYPPCRYCRKPCLDLALECTKPECDYIIHWDCRWPKY